MLTLRDTTDQALFSRIQCVLPKIEAKMEAQRQERQERQQAQTPTNNGNGNGNSHKPDAAPPTIDDEPYCDYHDVPLKQYSKDGRSWYSHYDNETEKWCRGIRT